MPDDLIPSGADKRDVPAVGTQQHTTAPDFTAPDTEGNSFNLYSALAQGRPVVLYFTMWCPVCDSHMDHMLRHAVKNFPDIRFVIIDYVSGSVERSRRAALAAGYANTAYTVLIDMNHQVLDAYGATMGATVVIDHSASILMNEDYKNGIALETILGGAL